MMSDKSITDYKSKTIVTKRSFSLTLPLKLADFLNMKSTESVEMENPEGIPEEEWEKSVKEFVETLMNRTEYIGDKWRKTAEGIK